MPTTVVGHVRIGKPAQDDMSQDTPPTLTPMDSRVGDIPLVAEMLPGAIVSTDILTTEVGIDLNIVPDGEQDTTLESEESQLA